MIEFVSYDGKYPNLCSGTLILKINGKERIFPEYCLHSNGCAYIDVGGNDHVSKRPWSVDIPEDLKEYTVEIEECVNENVGWGCCGGCL